MINFSRHPKALPYLFLTEMWERFGFYVVNGMLVLYMAQGFGFSDNQSYAIAGVFSALAYISPMIGGFVADHILGFKTAIAWGGILLCIGYAMLALPWEHGLYLSLATIIVGNGLFKPNISSLLGTLYAPHDTGRDAGFTIFYVGINLGAVLAGLSSGVIKNHFGWHAGFALASIGILIGLATFTLGIRICHLNYKSDLSLAKKFWLKKSFLAIYLVIAIGLVSLLMRDSILSNWLLPTIGVFLLFFIFGLAFKQSPLFRNRLILLNFLSIAAVIFWMFYLQIFFSCNLFIDRLVDKTVFGWHIPTTAFYTIISMFIILLGPAFAWSWQTLQQNNRNPSLFSKFTLAIAITGLGFLILSISTFFANDVGLINPLWIVLAYFCITIGELLLSPIGLSAVTLLAPPKLIGLMMGIWFVALGFGGEFGGMLAKLASVAPNVTDSYTQLHTYRMAFFEFAGIAFAVSGLLFLSQLLPRWGELGKTQAHHFYEQC